MTKSNLIVAGPLTSRGGTFRRLQLWRRHIPAGAELRLLYWDNEGGLFRQWQNASAGAQFSAIYSRAFNKLGRFLVFPMLIFVAWQIRCEKPDHLISDRLWGALAGLLLKRMAAALSIKLPRWTMFVAGDPVPPTRFPWFLPRVYRYIAVSALREADAVAFQSQKMMETTAAKYSIDFGTRGKVLPITVERIPDTMRECMPGIVRFGIVSRLNEVKRIDDIIRAFKLLRDSHKEGDALRLDIWGGGPMEADLKKLVASMQLKDAVLFHGWLDEPYFAFERIDVLVMSSEKEGTPRSILEAGSLGVPTVSTSVGGISDLITDGVTGWLVDPGDTRALCRAMSDALDERKRIQFGTAMRESILQSRAPGSDAVCLFGTKNQG